MTTIDTSTDAQKLEQLIGLKRRKIALLSQLRDAQQGPDTAGLAAGLESSRAYGGQGERDLASMFPSGQAPALANPEPWKAADSNSGFNRPGGTGLSPEERMIGVQPNYAGMAPAVRSSVQAYYQQTGNTDVPPDQIPMDWSRRGQGIEATRPSGLSPEELAVQQRRAIRDIETQRYAQAMGDQTGGVVDSAIRGAVAPANTVLRSLIGYADAQGNPALTEAVDAATRARPEGMPARIASGAASMAPVLTVGALGGTPVMLGAMGAQSFTDAFRQYQADLERKGDVHATGKALAAAAAIAPLEAGLNVIPAHRFLGALERAAPGFGAFLRARAVDAATNAGIGAAADLTRQAGGVASGAQDGLDLRQTLEAMPEQAAVGGVVGAATAAHGIGARGERMGEVRDLRQAQADARATGGVPEQAGAYQPRPVNPWEQNKAAPIAPIGRGTTTAQVPDGAGPPAGVKESFDANTRSPPQERPVANGERQPGAAGDRRGGVDEPANARPLDTRVPPVVGDQGAPAGAESRNVDGAPAVDLYPRARAILDELGVPDAGEVADRLGITLPEADRLVGRWEQEQSSGSPGQPTTLDAAQTPGSSAARDASPERGQALGGEAGATEAALVAARSRGEPTPETTPQARRSAPPQDPSQSRSSSASPESTRPALGSSRLNIPEGVVTDTTRPQDQTEGRPTSGRGSEIARPSSTNAEHSASAARSTAGEVRGESPEGPGGPAPRRTPQSVSARESSPPESSAAAAGESSPSRSSGEGTREGKQPWEVTREEYREATRAAPESALRRSHDFVKTDLAVYIDGKLHRGEHEGIHADIVTRVLGEASGDKPYEGHEIIGGFVDRKTGGEFWPQDRDAYHKMLVRQALSEGRPVPAEVLKDYPDLQQSGKPAEKSGKPSRLSRLADTLAAKAEALKAGPGVRQGKATRGTRAGASDLHKVAGYAAMKAAEGAIRLADTVQGYAEKGIRITREMAEDAIRRFKGSHDPAEVMRLGNRMIRAATNKDGTIDPHKLELARAEMISRAVDEAPEPTQAQRDRQQQKAVNTAAAIERGKGQDSAAVREEMALRMGTAKGKRKLSEQAEAHREAMQAQRESFADKLDELRAQKAVGLDVRREIVKLAKEKLDPADRFRIMDFLAGADFKNPTAKKADVTRDILAGVTRILHIADTAAERRSKAELRAIVGKAARPSTGPKLAGEVNADLGVKGEPKKLARGTVNARDVAQLRTPVRDALTEVVDSLRNDHTTGAGKLADFLEKQGTAEADMSVGVSDYFSAEELARIKAMDNKLSDDLTPDDRTLLGNAIKHAAHLSAEGDKFQVGSEKRAFGEVKAKTIEEVKTRGKEAANPQRAIEGGAGKLLQGAKELVTTDQMDLSRMLGTVAGTDSTLHDTAYKALADGESAQKLLVREAMDKSGLKDWKAKDIARANQRRTVKLSSGVQKLRGWEMMEILGHYMDPSTQHEIEQAPFLREADKGKHKDRAFFATREDLATIESMLTARERALVPKLHDALKLVYREANDAHEDLLGFRLPDQPFHWSRVRDRTKVNEGLDARVARQTRFEDSGMYKERTGSKEPIVLRNPFEWVPEAIHQHAGMAKLARPMRNVRRLLNDPEVRSALTTAGGDNFLTKAEGRIAELVPAPGSGDGTAINRIMQGLLGRYASAKLAFRISSVAKQRLGLFQAASVADDPKLAARLSAEAFKPLPILPAEANRLRAEINPRSGYLSERADPAFAATLQSAANPHLKVATTAVGQAWNAVERVGLSGLQAADSGVVLRTYRSVKAHLEGQGFMGGELLDRAVRQTEHIIRDSQNPTSPLDMSGLNLAGRKNPWLGAALMFTSSANKMRNVLVQTISDTRADPSAKNLGKLAKVTALTGANAIAEYGIGLATGGAAIGAIASWASGGDDERKKVGMAQKVLANLADVVQPGAGDAIRTFQNPDSAGTTIGKAITAARAVAKVADDETMRGSDKAVRIINAARALLPVVPDAPLDYAQNIIRGVAGSEMTNQTGGIKAALQRGDEKSIEQARQRIQKYIAAKVAEPAKEFTEAEDPQDKADRIRAGLRSRLLKLSGTSFDKLSQEQQDTLEGMDNPPDWYAAERAKYDEWAAKVEKLLPE